MVVPLLVDAIARRDGRPAAMRSAVKLGEVFAGEPSDPLLAAAIRIEAIGRLATGTGGEWPDGLPLESVRSDLGLLSRELGADSLESLECELLLARLLAASGDPAARAEAKTRAESIRERAEGAGQAAAPFKQAAERLLAR